MSERILKGYWATWDADSIGDRILPGAFSEDIKARGPRKVNGQVRSEIKLGYNHETVIGLPLVMREDSFGLYVEARVSRTSVGNDVVAMIEDGTLDSCSFSFDVLQSEGTPPNRVLKKLRVYEGGPVDWACNKAAHIIGFKSALDMLLEPDDEPDDEDEDEDDDQADEELEAELDGDDEDPDGDDEAEPDDDEDEDPDDDRKSLDARGDRIDELLAQLALAIEEDS